jgi:di/tricarboxylate transporter
MSLTLCINPIYLMMTCAISCSYAFMLPVATAPNAIVFSHSTMKTSGQNMKTKCCFVAIYSTIIILTPPVYRHDAGWLCDELDVHHYHVVSAAILLF